MKEQAANPVKRKFEIAQQIASDCFGINKLEDLENLALLIRQQKDLSNKLFWARANANTGKTAIETQTKMEVNEQQIKKHTSQMTWEQLTGEASND